MKIINNNGHTLNGLGRGAIGYLDESICTRQIGKYFIEGMRSLGHTVYDCTIDKSSSYLYEAVNKANKYKVEPYVIAADVYGSGSLAGRGGWTCSSYSIPCSSRKRRTPSILSFPVICSSFLHSGSEQPSSSEDALWPPAAS